MKTIKVRRGNKVKQIIEDSKERYLAEGFDVIDDKGKVIKRGNRPSAKIMKELEEENEKLKKEIKELKAKK